MIYFSYSTLFLLLFCLSTFASAIFPLSGAASAIPLLLAILIYLCSRALSSALSVRVNWFFLLSLFIIFLTYSIVLNPLQSFVQASYSFLLLPIVFIFYDYFYCFTKLLRLLFFTCLSFVSGQSFLIALSFYESRVVVDFGDSLPRLILSQSPLPILVILLISLFSFYSIAQGNNFFLCLVYLLLSILCVFLLLISGSKMLFFILPIILFLIIFYSVNLFFRYLGYSLNLSTSLPLCLLFSIPFVILFYSFIVVPNSYLLELIGTEFSPESIRSQMSSSLLKESIFFGNGLGSSLSDTSLHRDVLGINYEVIFFQIIFNYGIFSFIFVFVLIFPFFKFCLSLLHAQSTNQFTISILGTITSSSLFVSLFNPVLYAPINILFLIFSYRFLSSINSYSSIAPLHVYFNKLR